MAHHRIALVLAAALTAVSSAASAQPAARFPRAPGGVRLGAPLREVESACRRAGHRWLYVEPIGHVCSGAIESIGQPVNLMQVYACGTRACGVMMHVAFGADTNLEGAFADLAQALEQRYGPPEVTREGSETCLAFIDDPASCFGAGRARILHRWWPRRGGAVVLVIDANNEGRARLAIIYLTREFQAQPRAL